MNEEKKLKMTKISEKKIVEKSLNKKKIES